MLIGFSMEYLATKQMIKYPESRGPSIFLHKSYLGRSNGLCSQGNDKDTWKGAQRECTTSRGDLVKVDDDNQKRFLIHFMEVTGLKKTKIDASTESLTLLSPKTEQHEFFLLTSVRYKTEWDTEVNFDFVFLLSIRILLNFVTMRAF